MGSRNEEAKADRYDDSLVKSKILYKRISDRVKSGNRRFIYDKKEYKFLI